MLKLVQRLQARLHLAAEVREERGGPADLAGQRPLGYRPAHEGGEDAREVGGKRLLEPRGGADVELVPLRVVLDERAGRVLALELLAPALFFRGIAIRTYEGGLADWAQDCNVRERKRRVIFHFRAERAGDGVVLGSGATCHEIGHYSQDIKLPQIDKKRGSECTRVGNRAPLAGLILLTLGEVKSETFSVPNKTREMGGFFIES